jgi:hypothetical protein
VSSLADPPASYSGGEEVVVRVMASRTPSEVEGTLHHEQGTAPAAARCEEEVTAKSVDGTTKKRDSEEEKEKGCDASSFVVPPKKQRERFTSETERVRCAKDRLTEEELVSVSVNNTWVVSTIVDHVIANLNSTSNNSTVLVTNILLERDLFPCREWALDLKRFRSEHDPRVMGTLWRTRWTGELQHLLIPTNIRNRHWCLLVVELPSGNVELWDSFKAQGGTIYKQIDQMRLQSFMDVFSPATPKLHFKVVPVPQQAGSNCGICDDFRIDCGLEQSLR